MIKGIRYQEIDGRRNMPNSFIMSLWNKVVLEKKEGYTELYPAKYGPEDFLRVCQREHFWIFVEGEEIFGFMRIANLRPKRAEVHFCAFDGFQENIVRYGKLAVATIIDYYGLDIVYGYIAQTNKKALKYVVKLGWKEIGILPKGSYIYPQGKSVNSVIVCFGG